MKAHIIEGGVVANTIILNGLDEHPGAIDADLHGGGIGWAWDGNALTKPPATPKTPEELQAGIVAQTQDRLDSFAKTRNYDGILSACTYATSSVPKFQAEGQYAVNARDQTWATLYTVMADVQAGQWAMPESFDDIEPLLPQLTWPS